MQYSEAMVLVIDHYDSFTYNLVHEFGALGAEVEVLNFDQVTIDDVLRLAPSHLVISPGPGHPRETGASLDLIRRLYRQIPILGVCLGHQALAVAFGGEVVPAVDLVHGRSSWISHDGQGVFRGLETPLEVGRYHSWVVDSAAIPDGFEVSARTAEGLVMGMRHREYPVEGIQFHPESVLTPSGRRILGNFLQVIDS